MSKTKDLLYVETLEDVAARVRELVKDFILEDRGIGHYEAWGATGRHRSICLNYDGPDELLFVVADIERGDDPFPLRWTHSEDEHEAEMVARWKDIAEIPQGCMVKVTIEQE